MGPLKLYTIAECQQFIKDFPDEFAAYGCGPGGIGDYLVPDTVYGLSIKPACQRHDWGYRHDEEASEENRKMHDRILRNNSLRIVVHYTGPGFLRRLRFHRVGIYYHMVRTFGGPAYWEERNEDKHMQDVTVS